MMYRDSEGCGSWGGICCRRHLPHSLVLSLLAMGITSVEGKCEDATIVHVPAGETKLIYWEVNLSGVVWISIRRESSLGCAELFWRTYPFFGRTPLGERCGSFQLSVPSLSSGALAAALYARANDDGATVVGGSNESVVVKVPYPAP